MLDAVRVLVGGAVEAAELVVDDPGVFDLELIGTGSQRRGEGERGPLELLVVGSLADLDRARFGGHPGGPDRDLGAVEDDGVDLFDDPDRDRDPPVEGEGLEVWLERQFIGRRYDQARQAIGVVGQIPSLDSRTDLEMLPTENQPSTPNPVNRGAGFTLPSMDDRSTILVAVNGPDGPGISAGLMQVLADSGAEIYDVEQIVVRGRLTLNVLIGVAGEKSTIGELLFFGWQRGLHVEFEVVDDAPTPTKAMSAVTVIGMRIGPEEFGAVATAIAAGNGNIERIFRLSRYPVVSYELLVSDGDISSIREGLVLAAAQLPIDVAIQPDGLERRAKRMVIMDVDSTLIQHEVINLLAREAGVEEQVSEMTHLALTGEMDFETSLRERVAMLKGVDQVALTRVFENITLTSGARTFIRTLKRLGMVTAIVSAGFTRFTNVIAADLGIDYSLVQHTGGRRRGAHRRADG